MSTQTALATHNASSVEVVGNSNSRSHVNLSAKKPSKLVSMNSIRLLVQLEDHVKRSKAAWVEAGSPPEGEAFEMKKAAQKKYNDARKNLGLGDKTRRNFVPFSGPGYRVNGGVPLPSQSFVNTSSVNATRRNSPFVPFSGPGYRVNGGIPLQAAAAGGYRKTKRSRKGRRTARY